MAKPARENTGPVTIQVKVPNDGKCRVAMAVKMYAAAKGSGSQSAAIVKIIKENKEIKEFIRQIYVSEIVEVKKARAQAIADGGMASYDRMMVGR